MLAYHYAGHSDIPVLLTLVNSAYRGEASRQGWTTEADFFTENARRIDASGLAGMLANPKSMILLCHNAAGTPVACVYLEQRGDRLYLGMLSVAPGLQGQGIGKFLLRAAETEARRLNCRSIFMQVIDERDTLIDWYYRHGYRDTGARVPFDVPPEKGGPQRPLVFAILEKPVD
jgi:ribosomal protein S18 acetylase RimI-like enzyme